MKKYLVIAEKNELAKAIEKAITHFPDGSFCPKGEYTFVAASGHLFELKAPEDYDPRYKQWSMSDLPIGFRNWAKKPKEDAGSQKRLAQIQEELDTCDEVIHAGDPDDEGQLIVDEILAYYNCRKPCWRLLVNDLSEKQIRKQASQMKNNELWKPLGEGADARGIADFLFGINYTRYYTLAYHRSGHPLSVGRVQTPTLGLVVARDKQVEEHIDTKYYTLNFSAQADTGAVFPVTFNPAKDDPSLVDGHIENKAYYDPIITALNGATLTGNVERTIQSSRPPLPFNLAKLTSFCGEKFGLNPEQTLAATQSLRTVHNAITYNRSTMRYLNESQFYEAPDVLAAVKANFNIDPPVDTSIRSKCFDDKKMEGASHHAIIPTANRVDLSKLSANELKVYRAITLYYLVQFMPDKKTEHTGLDIPVNGGTIHAVANRVLDPGYSGYLKEKESNQELSPLADVPVGSHQITLSAPEISEKTTKPPQRYTQSTLAEDMTAVAKYVTDPEVKKILLEKDEGDDQEKGSIGTPATRAGIITTLLKRGYIEEIPGKGKSPYIRSTELGRKFYSMLPDSIRGVNVTAEWWLITKGIQEGYESKDRLYDDVFKGIEEFLQNPPPLIEGIQTSAAIDHEPVGNCPRCGRPVIEGKKGFGCTGYKADPPCSFIIWKKHPILENSGKAVTSAMASSLLSRGKTTVRGLTSKSTGSKYDADFVLQDDGTKVSLQMELRMKKFGKVRHAGR